MSSSSFSPSLNRLRMAGSEDMVMHLSLKAARKLCHCLLTDLLPVLDDAEPTGHDKAPFPQP